ncbi:siderophore-interacting protein [[Mycobacterium] burgundiense]|uniref:Siderophore-interacting protein n=1 Tax=[Mycobacterium] burgundiense TaxID=3064286 RepID=A0ABM9LXP1_9MYCO|nr:siderophore-interacting protein [Mycolicibacterium sp. MU0053]CAJ1506475.1 siderophore-interacting protein [Mycolicibacterium sp. MU0053]
MAGRPLHTLEVVRTEWITPHMVRVILGGKGFDAFTPKDATDSYLKIAFVPVGVDVAALERPLTLDSFGPEQRPVVRTYTVRRVDPVARELTIDFVVHGDQGVAGPWAAGAQPGDPLYLTDPNGGFSPDPAADWYLFAGDEAGTPAISTALEALPSDAVGYAFIEIADQADELELSVPDGVRLTWVYRGGRADLVSDDQAGDRAPLIEAVKAAPWLPGQVQVFIHGEAQAVMHNLRAYIRKEREVPAKWASSISGYWRRGRTEETFRQWKRELAEAEAAKPA